MPSEDIYSFGDKKLKSSENKRESAMVRCKICESSRPFVCSSAHSIWSHERSWEHDCMKPSSKALLEAVVPNHRPHALAGNQAAA